MELSNSPNKMFLLEEKTAKASTRPKKREDFCKVKKVSKKRASRYMTMPIIQVTKMFYYDDCFSQSGLEDGWIRCEICYKWAHDNSEGIDEKDEEFIRESYK